MDACDYWSLLGLDFLPSDDEPSKLWLLEANTGPRLWFDEANADTGKRVPNPPTPLDNPTLKVVDEHITRPLLLDTAELLARIRTQHDRPLSPENKWAEVDLDAM